MTVDESGIGLWAAVQICARLNRAARIRCELPVGG